MKLSLPSDRSRRVNPDDQTLPLINIAFLLLIFFLLAGTLLPSSPLDVTDLELSQGVAPEGDAEEWLVVARDGRLAYRGEIIDLDAVSAGLFVGLQGPLPLYVDARTDARSVVDLLRTLARAGVSEVRLVGTELRTR